MKRLILAAMTAALPAILAAAPVPSQGLGPFAMFREDTVGRRLVGIVFDLSMLPGKDLARAVATASDYVARGMSSRDVVAVSTLGASLDTLQDFTADRARLLQALERVTPASRSAGPESGRLSEVTSFCRGLGALQQDSMARFNAGRIGLDAVVEQTSVIYFGSGVMRGLQDPAQLGAVAAACGRQNVVFYAIDSRTAPGPASR